MIFTTWGVEKPEPPNYLCFTAEEAGSTVKLNKAGNPSAISIETSTDKTTWENFVAGETIITLENVGDKIYFRGDNDSLHPASYDYYYFQMSGLIKASGNIMALLDSTCKQTSILSENCFMSLFYNCTSLMTAPELPALELSKSCYYQMFSGCTSLTTAPELPALELANRCYYKMFSGCTSLTTASELPALVCQIECYYQMFSGCTSLTTAPELPALELADICYFRMFYGCTSIRVSEDKISDYDSPYRIPSSGNGTAGLNSLNSMFSGTGGTFTGTPEINTTYYGAW